MDELWTIDNYTPGVQCRRNQNGPQPQSYAPQQPSVAYTNQLPSSPSATHHHGHTGCTTFLFLCTSPLSFQRRAVFAQAYIFTATGPTTSWKQALTQVRFVVWGFCVTMFIPLLFQHTYLLTVSSGTLNQPTLLKNKGICSGPPPGYTIEPSS